MLSADCFEAFDEVTCPSLSGCQLPARWVVLGRDQVSLPARCLRIAAPLGAMLLFPLAQVCAQSHSDLIERTIVVSVVDEHGRNLRGLGPNYFRGKFRGKPVETLSAEEAPPHRVVLVYDISGSMTADRPLPRLATERFLALMPPQVPVAFLSFASKIHDQLTFQTDRSEILAHLRNPDAINWEKNAPIKGRKTALFDALSAALQMFGNPQPGDSIMIVSDGGENASRITESQILREARSAGTRIYALLAANPLPTRARAQEEVVGPATLRQISEATGGDIYSFDMDELHHFAEETPPRHQDWVEKHLAIGLAPLEILVREMNGFYALKIRLPEPVAKPQNWKLEVVDPATGKPDHHLVLHYPSQLMPLPERVP